MKNYADDFTVSIGHSYHNVLGLMHLKHRNVW